MPHQKSSHVHAHLSAKALQRQLFLLKDQTVPQAAVTLVLECAHYPLYPPAGPVGCADSAAHFCATRVRLLCVVTATSQWAAVGKNSQTFTNITDIRTVFTRQKTVLLWSKSGVGPRTARDDEPHGVKRCGPHSSASTGSCVEGGGFHVGWKQCCNRQLFPCSVWFPPHCNGHAQSLPPPELTQY